VLVRGTRGGERGTRGRRLAASATVAVLMLAIDMNPLAVFGATLMLDEQSVEGRRELAAQTEQTHPYREVSDKRPAPPLGASGAM
jgi:hypothetical protein